MTHEPNDIACGHCRERLHAYLDGELAATESASVGRHLETCAACFERSELEEAFRRTIRDCAGSASQPASPEFEDRIRRCLDSEDERRAEIALAGGRPAERRPRTRANLPTWGLRALVAAATFLIVVATWSALNVPRVGDGEAQAAVLHPAFMKGHLVCLDCEMAKMDIPSSGLDLHLPEAGIPSADPAEHHRLHLRSDTGRLWELFPEAEAVAALETHDNAGREASLVGTAFPEIGVLRVARLSFD